MSMGSVSGRVIPSLTVRMARASNPRGTAAMWVRDRLDELFVDEGFADWFPVDGRRGLSPARLALVSVLQYGENLTDRQAAEAVRCRLEWKYCLGMDLDDAGFDYSALSEFRDRLAEGNRADRLLAMMVDHLVAAGLVKRRGAVRTDSTHVLAAVRTLNRTEWSPRRCGPRWSNSPWPTRNGWRH
jgi:transposase